MSVCQLFNIEFLSSEVLSGQSLLTCRDAVVPVDRGRLRRVAGAHLGRAEFRAYATLFWVAKTLVIGYVLVSLQTKGGAAGVRAAAGSRF